MVGRLMTYTNNYFERFAYVGKFTFKDGKLILADTSKFKVGQYIRIMDSLLNDGIYKIKEIGGGTISTDISFIDEEFNGYVVGLAVPKNFVDLAEKIGKRACKDGLSSESIQGFYSVSYGGKNAMEQYSNEINIYAKPYTGIYEFTRWVDVYDV